MEGTMFETIIFLVVVIALGAPGLIVAMIGRQEPSSSPAKEKPAEPQGRLVSQ